MPGSFPYRARGNGSDVESPPSYTELRQRGVIPLLAGARVFPEAQPREWAAPADSSSEGLGNNSENKGYEFWVSSHFVQGFHPDNGRR